MEKRISYSQFQQVKAAAKMINPNICKIESLKKKIEPLAEEIESLQTLNASLEEGIVKIIGFHVYDLVKKVIEPTGATDKAGKPIKVTKYLPTDIVSYDEQKKEYVITVPDNEGTNVAGSDYDKDLEAFPEATQEASEVADEPTNEPEAEGLPWNN